jgi:ankyrin repeat protein
MRRKRRKLRILTLGAASLVICSILLIWCCRTPVLAYASYKGWNRVACAMLAIRADPNELTALFGRGPTGEATALMLATRRGHAGLVAILFQHGADVNVCNRGGASALHLACGGWHIVRLRRSSDVVTFLIERGAKVNATDSGGCTALHFAAKWSYAELVQALVRGGADLEARDAYGDTPLMYSVHADGIEAMAALLDLGADVNAVDNDGKSALLIAASSPYYLPKTRIRMLVEAGADVRHRDVFGMNAIDYLREAEDVPSDLIDYLEDQAKQ